MEGDFYRIEEVDKKPQPTKIEAPKYPDEWKKEKLQAKAVLACVVTSKGKCTQSGLLGYDATNF
ncbi:MAG: hypothetical protein MI922_06605 [Bacteroidales bacterium]|nr:hypothetical protein [Bacteroidales bacterium]